MFAFLTYPLIYGIFATLTIPAILGVPLLIFAYIVDKTAFVTSTESLANGEHYPKEGFATLLA